jgi:hypothetical protein
MAFDVTDYTAIITPGAWSATGGNGTADQRTGAFPVYPNGETITMSSFPANYGYHYSANAGHITGAAGPSGYPSGYLYTPYSGSNTAAQVYTRSMRFKYVKSDTYNAYLWGAYDDTAHQDYSYVGLGTYLNKILWYMSNNKLLVVTSTTLTDGATHTVHWVKNGTALKIFIDGAEASYTTNAAYDGGTVAITCKQSFLSYHDAAAIFIGELYWTGINTTAFDAARCLAEHNSGNTMGCYGTNTGNTMALTFPSTSAAIPVYMNQYRQRKN